MRSQKDVEFDICDLEAQLEHANTHGMHKAGAKIECRLIELDAELEEITGHNGAERMMCEALGA